MSGDQGLQAERTWLAWRRTTASSAVLTLLLVHFAVHQLDNGAAVAASAGAGTTLLLLLLGRYRERNLLRIDQGNESPPNAVHPLVIAVIAAAAAVTAGITLFILA